MVGSTNTVESFNLPDLLAASSRFVSRLNAHYDQAMAECRTWLIAHEVVGDKTERVFAMSDIERLCARAYPSAPYDKFLTVCEFVCLMFAIDEVCDVQGGADAKRTGERFLNALRGKERDDYDEPNAGLMHAAREIHVRLGDWLDSDAGRRFIEVCEGYIECVVEESALREDGKVLSLEEYEPIRRENSGVRPSIAITEFALGLSLLDTVYTNEHFLTVYWTVSDMVWWANDIYSYAVEYQKGLDGNNVLTVLMSDKTLDLQAASDYAGEHYKTLIRRHWAAREALAQLTFGSPEIDAQVALFVEEMANWAIGNAVWSFETRRYLGDDGLEVKESRRAVLRTRFSDEKRMPA
ncbi:terpenoid synthase [Exidia glandulosa HHB12029]|uniref:Terpene synthase n=1 Tax=Exidia glandulosa HHB12029 TaxID=1314781 RepID=A0A165GKN7_EXIGL|nr:terpenoid synthase [Exidia glandulosa HHB12029]